MSNEQSETIKYHDEVLFGKDGNPGIAHKVNFMWRVHVWLIGIVVVVTGFAFRWVIDTFGQIH